VTDSTSGQTSSTVIGTETPLGESARIYSEYQWEHTDDSDRNISLIGAERQWEVAEGLKLQVSGEYSAIDSQPADTNRYAIAAGLAYSNSSGISAATRAEIRRDEGSVDSVQYLTSNFVELKLNPDFTLLGKLRYSKTLNEDTDETDASFTVFSVGLAYRPVAFDRFNALAKYTLLADLGPQRPGDLEVFDTRTDVASIEWSFDITRTLEWVEKFAYKTQSEKVGSLTEQTTGTFLSISRLNWNFWRTFALGLEYRILAETETDDRRMGWLTELMWEPIDHFRVGAGYNFTDFSDNEFSANDYSSHGWYFRFQVTY
jgi:hypothetical protein